ncbi:hypothetical protein JCM19233_2490 [Vibrio astriarenae]|nr:hypothetical protein JCM19233_2490 [Vibrio sp. C7]
MLGNLFSVDVVRGEYVGNLVASSVASPRVETCNAAFSPYHDGNALNAIKSTHKASVK